MRLGYFFKKSKFVISYIKSLGKQKILKYYKNIKFQQSLK